MQYFEYIKKELENNNSAIISKKIPCDLLTPVLTLLKIKKKYSDYHFLFESVEKGRNKGRYSIIGIMPDLVWKSENKKCYINDNPSLGSNNFKLINDKPLSSLRKLIKESQIKSDKLLPLSSGIFGYMSYDMVKLMEDITDSGQKDEINIPDSIFIRPQIIIIFDGLYDEINICAPIYCQKGLNAENAYKKAQSNIEEIIKIINSSHSFESNSVKKEPAIFQETVNEKQYCQMVEKSKEYITNGDVFQVLPSRRISTDFDQKQSFSFYRSLRSVNPSPFLFYLQFPDFCFTGSSPEIMVSVKDRKVTIRPLAGTRKRGKTPQEDKKLAKELLNDKKELAEHLMLIDLGRNDAGKVCQDDSVKVTEKMIIEYYSHVMHISSNVEGILRDDLESIDALISGFPAGTVCGAPKIRAMEIIEELEDIKRSFYAGCVGYFAGNGNMETCISLRCALIKNNKIYIQTGAGVVFDSNPKAEYKECQKKAGAMIAALENVDKYT